MWYLVPKEQTWDPRNLRDFPDPILAVHIILRINPSVALSGNTHQDLRDFADICLPGTTRMQEILGESQLNRFWPDPSWVAGEVAMLHAPRRCVRVGQCGKMIEYEICDQLTRGERGEKWFVAQPAGGTTSGVICRPCRCVHVRKQILFGSFCNFWLEPHIASGSSRHSSTCNICSFRPPWHAAYPWWNNVRSVPSSTKHTAHSKTALFCFQHLFSAPVIQFLRRACAWQICLSFSSAECIYMLSAILMYQSFILRRHYSSVIFVFIKI